MKSNSNISSTRERLRSFRARNLEYMKAGYDRIAAARQVVEFAGKLEGPVLDVGTGKGLFAIELAKTGVEVISVDVNDQEIDLADLLARKAGVRNKVQFIHADASSLPWTDGFYGSVAMMDVVHHMDRPRPVLMEMTRVLAEGGSMVIADFNESGFALVDRVHRERGQHHPRSTASVALARDELLSEGLQLVKQASKCFHDIAILRKE